MGARHGVLDLSVVELLSPTRARVGRAPGRVLYLTKRPRREGHAATWQCPCVFQSATDCLHVALVEQAELAEQFANGAVAERFRGARQ